MPKGSLIEESLTQSVIGAFFEVYNELGYGFLEQLYASAMERELRARGHAVGREVLVRLLYKGDHLGTQRIDMIVDERLVIEIKATFQLHAVAQRQLFNYLRATNLEVGLLLHFGPKPKFYREICRNRNTLYPPDPDYPPDPIPFVIDAAATKDSTAGGPDPSPSSCLK